MKKLKNFHINSEKLMKNEELLTLRGGYGTCYGCYNYNGILLGAIYGAGLTMDEALMGCRLYYPTTEYVMQGSCS
jgi:hypothetical protein